MGGQEGSEHAGSVLFLDLGAAHMGTFSLEKSMQKHTYAM